MKSVRRSSFGPLQTLNFHKNLVLLLKTEKVYTRDMFSMKYTVIGGISISILKIYIFRFLCPSITKLLESSLSPHSI